MLENAIDREIREYREEFARRFNYDVRAMMDAIRAQDEAEGRPVVRSVREYQAAQAERPAGPVAAEKP